MRNPSFYQTARGNECSLPPSSLKGGEKINTVFYQCSPQSIILSMQEVVVSSDIIKSNPEVGSRPKVGVK